MHYKLGQACVTNWGSFIITNWGKCCYKLDQLLQNGAEFITNWDIYIYIYIYIIINLQKSDMGRILLTISINFISHKDVNEECVMHSKSSNI